MNMLRTICFAIILFGWFGISESSATGRGIGVSPGNIEIGGDVQWPYTAPLLVANLSDDKEFFEIVIEADDTNIVSISSGRFSLAGFGQRQVFLTFEPPNGGFERSTTGIIKVSAIRASEYGLITGTGIKVPFTIEKSTAASPLVQKDEPFLAAAIGAIGGLVHGSFVTGLGAISLSIVGLWYVSIFTRRYFFSK